MISPTKTVSICITERHPHLRSLIRYGLAEAFVRLGLRLRIADGEPGDGVIVYGPAPATWRGASLSYDARCYNSSVRFTAVGSPPLWAPCGTAAENVDLIGGLVRLLTLADEAQIEETQRNPRGIFPVSALPAARREVRAVPLVEHHAIALGQQLERMIPGWAPAGRWPRGYRYAVVVTHDTDAVALSAPFEILFNGVKAVSRLDALRMRMMWDGLTRKCNDPLFGFRCWADIERASGLRSAFFVSGRHKVRPEINDCRSTVFNCKVNWDVLRGLASEGWEFGLHPPIRAKYDLDEFVIGKDILETHLRQPIYGLRHHYWAIDWRKPHVTFRKHIRAGFRYDSSIAWKNDNGFRAGTCLPYRPFDPEYKTALDIYELPTALMDGNVIPQGGDMETAVDRALQMADDVRQVGGVLNLDWHTEAAMERYCYCNQRTVLVRVLSKLLARADAWFATPWELIGYWDERRQALCSDRGSADAIAGIAAD
jgi:peptidoglycan/xylan/chitin deacetylase (PgdA/CDA1 family)